MQHWQTQARLVVVAHQLFCILESGSAAPKAIVRHFSKDTLGVEVPEIFPNHFGPALRRRWTMIGAYDETKKACLTRGLQVD